MCIRDSAFTSHRLPGIAAGDDPCFGRDLVPLLSLRIAATVVALVVLADDSRDAGQLGRQLDQRGAHLRMLLTSSHSRIESGPFLPRIVSGRVLLPTSW